MRVSGSRAMALAGLVGGLLAGPQGASALSQAPVKNEGPGGLVWLFLAVFVLGTLALAFMNTKRNEAE